MSKDVLFSKLVGVRRRPDDNLLELPLADTVQNHVGTMHASAQFALAEIASGDHLRQLFPEIAHQAVAVVRRAEIKYSKAVDSTLIAYASIDQTQQEKFLTQFDKKGRGLIEVNVDLKTTAGELATHAVYYWFVTKM